MAVGTCCVLRCVVIINKRSRDVYEIFLMLLDEILFIMELGMERASRPTCQAAIIRSYHHANEHAGTFQLFVQFSLSIDTIVV